MSGRHRTTTDQLRNESDAHDCLASIAAFRADDSKISSLRFLRETADSSSATQLAERFGVTRTTVYNRIDDLRKWGFLWQTDDGFRMTRAGCMAIGAYESVGSDLTDEAITRVAESQHRRDILAALDANAATKAWLAARERLPGRSTIQRIVEGCVDRGWVTDTVNGEYTTTPTGSTILESYRKLVTEFEQLIDKSKLLARLDYWAAPPVRALSGTDLVTNTSDDPHAVLNASVEAANIRSNGLEHLRSVTPLFDPTLYDIFEQFVDRETTFEVIYNKPTYRKLSQPRWVHYLAGAVAASNVEVRIHPDPLYTGVGIYNHDTVMLGGSTRFDQQYGIVGEGDELPTWANDTFDRLWAESKTPSERFGSWLKQTVDPRR